MAKIVQLRDRETSEKQYPVTIPQAVVDEAGRNIMEIIETYFKDSYTEADVMYGVEWDVTVADPAMTRIGNMALHRQLPIQNRMKGCLLDDDGNVVEYLPVTSWEGATLDGSRGQVMVELPEHYRKFETDGNIRRAKISEYPLPGYHVVPKMYISAYEATLQRSTNKLCSVKNLDPDYRGGDNNAEWDGTYRSLLGRPATYIEPSMMQQYARNRGLISEWNMLTSSCWKTVQWLYLIEYANRNSQLAFSSEKTAEGFTQGGLGMGATTMAYADWNSYFAKSPFIACGASDHMGNASGEVLLPIYNESGDLLAEVPCARYRGIENPFGHIVKTLCGAVAVYEDDVVNVYMSDGPEYVFDSTVSEEYRLASRSPKTSAVNYTNIAFGEYGDIIMTASGGGSNIYWCDQFWGGSSFAKGTVRAIGIGSTSINNYAAGMFATDAAWSVKANDCGTRLCFIPQNNK